jgi:ATP synthase protein I
VSTERPDDERSAVRAVGPYLTLGIQLALTIVVVFFIGRWLDAKFGTTPWLMIAALFIGCTGGMIQFIRTVNALTKQDDERARKKI